MHITTTTRSDRKCSCTVPWHLKEADLSHSLEWHGMVLGSLPVGYISMSCYLFMSKKPHVGERPTLSIIINHPAQGSSRDRTFRWNAIFRLQGGTQYLGLKRNFWGAGLLFVVSMNQTWGAAPKDCHFPVVLPGKCCSNMVNIMYLLCYFV